jgi:3-hydroxyacyl-CoA dehydrogenase
MSTLPSLELRNFAMRIDPAGLVWLTVDCAESSVNRLSTDVLRELNDVLDHFDAQTPAGMIILSGKQSGFIAGADINEFDKLNDVEGVRRLVQQGWTTFERIARLPYPTLALIRGFCLGGGLELALACRYRLAVDHPETALGLPEVMLGIFPAWGGMKRLPALIGAPAALDMMLSGRSVDARKARNLGLVDALVPARLEHRAAERLVRSGQRPAHAKGVHRLLNSRPLRPLVARWSQKQVNKRDPYQHYIAPRAILDIWARYDGNALNATKWLDEIIQSDTAHHLIRVFRLQERLKASARTASQAHPIRHVHIVGAGVMGGDIASWCSLKGLRVTLQDQDRERIASAQGRATQLFGRRLKDKRLQQAAFDRLVPDPEGQGVLVADLVIEAITEDASAKKALYSRIEPLMKPEALLASNTSSLSLAELGANLRAPARFVGIHFFNPVAKMPLVEVVTTPQLADSVHATAMAFVEKLGKLPLSVQDTPGFLVNAVLAPYMLEAMRCVDDGLPPETIDEAMKVFGMPMGPLELADTVGLDVVAAAGRQLAGEGAVPSCLTALLARQELGRKTGKGFYRWSAGKPVKQAARTPPSGLALRLITPLVEKTREQVDRRIVADADLADAGVIFGTGFAPFTGGPLHWSRNHAESRPFVHEHKQG